MTPEEQLPAVPQPHRVSVVIVSHNRAADLRRGLAALGDTHQVLVVDNASSDETSLLDLEFPAVRFIRLPKNFGYVKAMNLGARSADGSLILFLHDDTEITGEAVTKLADFLDARVDAGAVCPLLVDRSGKPSRQVRPLPTPSQPDPKYVPAAPGDNAGGGEIVAQCVSGAAIMLRTSFLKALRNVDERYGNYGSDPELCQQVKRANRKLVVLKNVTAIHEWPGSPEQASTLEGDRTHGTAAFLGKHHGVMAGMVHRLKAGLMAVLTFRFAVIGGAFSGEKIDGSK
ncbi:MAG: glycosyltransferase [Acidobacteriia bacterium]|nr:glycosyltransferase [Terriglobia bacterium]